MLRRMLCIILPFIETVLSARDSYQEEGHIVRRGVYKTLYMRHGACVNAFMPLEVMRNIHFLLFLFVEDRDLEL